MSNPMPNSMPIENTSTPTASTQPTATDPTTAGAAAQSNAPAGFTQEVNSKTKITSMADLKRKDPKLYNFMMQSIAMNVCIQMETANDHLIAMMKKNQQDAQG